MSLENLNSVNLNQINPQRNQFDEQAERIAAQRLQDRIDEHRRLQAQRLLEEKEEEGRRVDTVNRVVNQLKIPDAIKDLPTFKGDKNGLYDFIQNVEEILTICRPACNNNPTYTSIIIRAIRNKIIDDANDVLLMYGTEINWDQIRANLILHYADKRDETSLIRDLHRLSQGSDTVEKFFSRIIDILNTMTNGANINTPRDENRLTVITAKQSLYNSMCLSVFLAGLREPMGSMIRAMRPTTLPEAFSFCLKEQNIGYMKQKSMEPYKQVNNIPPRLPPKPVPIYNPQFRNNLIQYQRNPFPQQQQYFNHRPFTRQNHQPFQPNRAILPPKPQNLKPKLEPMDTSSNFNKYKQPTYGQQPHFQRNPNPQFPPRNPFHSYVPPRFQSQELFNVEEQINDPYTYYSEDQNLYDFDYYTEHNETDNNCDLNPNEPVHELTQQNYVQTLDNEISDEDFHQKASPNLSDT